MNEAQAGGDALVFSAPYRVRFDEAGPDWQLRASGYLRYAQDVAWRHSEARGLDRAWYAERGLGWVVRAAELEIRGATPVGVSLDVTTRVLGYQRIWAQRRAECRLPGGEVAAAVRTDWVLLDARSRLVRVPEEVARRFPAPEFDGAVLRVRLPRPPDDAARRWYPIRRHELDPLNHPNNAVYVDWVEDALLGAGHRTGLGAQPGSAFTLRLEYVRAPDPGATVESLAWRTDRGWAVRLSGPDGQDLLRAELEG